MKEKVMSLAQGKFTYERPKIILSTEKLEFEVMEGGEAQASFYVSNSEHTKMKGFCAVREFEIEFLPVFDGKDNEITVRVHARNRKAGDVLAGEISIITDCGEKTLPYEIIVTGRYLEGKDGPLRSYAEFVKLAREHFEEAVQIFYHDKFEKIYLKEMPEKRLYQGLTGRNPKKQALEEFLVANGDKKPVQFMVNKKQLVYDVDREDIAGEIAVAKDSWGMVGIRVTSDHPYLVVDKSFLYDSDFEGGQAVVSFGLRASEVPDGIHRCHIIFENVYQRTEVTVRVHGIRGAGERKERLKDKQLTAKLVRGHIQYMMNSSRRESLLDILRKNKERLLQREPEGELLLEGYMSLLSQDGKGKTRFLNSVSGMTAPKNGDKTDRIVRYLLAQYVKCKINKDEEEREETISEIRSYYENGYRHWALLVLLERLGAYQENPRGLLDEINSLWEDGEASPYLHFYRIMLFLQEPELLTRLDSRTIGALRFGLKHDLITEDMAIAISFLASRKKRSTPALLAILEGCYDMYGSKDTLHSICALLIRSEKQEKRYFKWFRLGVEQCLRLTELFEYYMYTMDRDYYDEALSSVISYFRYENHLRDSVKVMFYASIVRNREEHPEYFQAYGNVIRDFTLKQLYEHRISKESAVLYESLLTEGNVRDRVAKELPYILYTYHIRCSNRNIERVVVAHDEGGGESVYNLSGGEAYIQIGTPHYRLYFVDKNGFYHTETVSYRLEKICDLDLLSEACYENGSDHPILLLHLFSEALTGRETGSRDAIILHTMLRNHVPGLEYESRALLALYEYYRSIGEDQLLEEIIGQIDFRYIDFEKRPGILQTMIQHRMNDAAVDALRTYHITNCSRKLILLLLTWKLEEIKGKFDPYLVRLADFLYRKGTKNPTTLSYLTSYYMGPTAHLREIYRDAGKIGVEFDDGAAERLLGQVLFVSENPESYAKLFLDYYEYGANRVLVKAFLGYTAYEYLVGRCGLAEGIPEKIKKEALSEDNQIMILTILKYYAAQDEYSEAEAEYIRYHVSRYVSTGCLLGFMKDFAGKLEVPFEVSHVELIQFFSSYRGDIYIELEEENGRRTTWPMRRVFTDMYVYETILFAGEKLVYRIYAGDMETPAAQGELVRKSSTDGQETSLYEIVNEMTEAVNGEDRERFDSLVEKYKYRRGIADRLFAPL